ncbi:NADH-quinone oxidoreductase subunit 5 family protein [Catellatospora tritici]|uniref:NADH-quinone oxidoreductase subunit 5 family protein n=1 Tax=Catellatospora tritici TaxID=2851566 RepID=UPI001C2D5995|nr:NADH-quinone oxidoreductase subunit L [Catellatospora tritici]MBV1849844.1 NADH-quinone oxidoreductase subunit L [Catellatospora tritici]
MTELLVLAPLLCGLVGLLVPMRNRPVAAALGIAGAAASLIAVVALLARGTTGAQTRTWVGFGDLSVTLTSLLDTRALLVALAVAVVALCVQVYSNGYLHGDERYGPYAAQISIFTAAMLTVVCSGDLILLLIGWEIMGACSYLLIAHDRALPEAPRAAVKAFLVTRVGDVGFLLGIALLGVNAGSFQITTVLVAVPTMGTGTVTAAALLLLAGVFGKSAQFPLHTWLPDAMAGPTPISALIHAATMVAAGVYVVARLYPVFAAAPTARIVLGVSAAITLLLGALAATAADDLKRVLAWSTVSQLGYMMAALSVGAINAALFHLLAHAAFKALLFLGAGSVIHAVGSNLMSRMGALRKPMPWTFWTMTIGLGSLAGLPPLVGFFSKEAVVGSLHEQPVLWAVALVGVALTAWYATRAWLRVFFGRGSEHTAHAHESNWWLRGPLVLLAIPSAGLGVGVLLTTSGLIHLDVEVLLPLALAALGGWAAWWGWRRADQGDPAQVLGTAGPFLAGGLGLDAVQDALVVRPVRALARAVTALDTGGVDGAVNGLGRATVAAGGEVVAWHRAPLPRALVAVLLGAVVVTVTAVMFG